MTNKYLVVRANSTTGPLVVELNQARPATNQWSKAQILDYANNKREARRIARAANKEEGRS